MARSSTRHMRKLGCLLLALCAASASKPLPQDPATKAPSSSQKDLSTPSSQNPDSAAPVTPDVRVTTVPDLVGLPGFQAFRTLRLSHLSLGEVTTKDKAENGFILSQDPLPDPNKKVLYGTKVDLVVGWPEILLKVDERVEFGTSVSASVTMKPLIAGATYRFGWGKDGKSPWQPDASASHLFATTDTYTVSVEIVAADISLPTKTATVVVSLPKPPPGQQQTEGRTPPEQTKMPGQKEAPKQPEVAKEPEPAKQPSRKTSEGKKRPKQSVPPSQQPSSTDDANKDKKVEGRDWMVALWWDGAIALVLIVGYRIWRRAQVKGDGQASKPQALPEPKIVFNNLTTRYQMAGLKSPPKCLVRIRWVQKGSRGSIMPKGNLIKKKGAAHAG